MKCLLSLFVLNSTYSASSAFVSPTRVVSQHNSSWRNKDRSPLDKTIRSNEKISIGMKISAAATTASNSQQHTWSPVDLTKDNMNYAPIPDDDYIKKYQSNPELWPIEFFIIPYRRVKKVCNDAYETKILVRKSANGTSKYGLGTGVPITRWMPSSQDDKPPKGYKVRHPKLTFDAKNFPEFPKDCENWTYSKIDIQEDAFHKDDEFEDSELEIFAKQIRVELKRELKERIIEHEKGSSSNLFELDTLSLVNSILEDDNSIAAIQGTLRMSGLFAKAKRSNEDGHACRYISFEDKAVDPQKLVKSMRIYTMFPQMPQPLPLPETLPEELQKEIINRPKIMEATGRDPHQDKHGRKFTHISTSNVSNTIHGIYFPIDCSDLPDLDSVPAYDLFGTKGIEKEWVSLSNLDVLEDDDKTVSMNDTKPTFISGFIVRQLVKQGVVTI
jgi:hypothetical protein